MKFNLGWVLTILWLVGIFCFYILGLFERPTSFNELGDFLAGVFAPVAFLWLILGYRQQSQQLEQNSTAINQQAVALKQQAEALNLQIEEMKESVHQQKELAKIQRDQLENQRKILKPFLSIIEAKCKFIEYYEDEYEKELVGYLSFNINFLVKNSDIRDLYITDSDEKVLYKEEFVPKDISAAIELDFEIESDSIKNHSINHEINISYKDSFEHPNSDRYVLGVKLDQDVGLEYIESVYCNKIYRSVTTKRKAHICEL